MKPKYLPIVLLTPFLVACVSFLATESTQPATTRYARPTQVPAKAGYCQARVTQDDANKLNRLVVNAYNRQMKDLPGFRPARLSESSTIPSISFADPARPALYYPKKGGKFHSTLCNRKKSRYFRCNDSNLVRNLFSYPQESAQVADYVRYYKEITAGKKYGYAGPPREFGPRFVAIPLQPETLSDDNGEVISGLMHISIAKIFTSDDRRSQTLQSRRLKDRFVEALRSDFGQFRSGLPSVSFRNVHCEK